MKKSLIFLISFVLMGLVVYAQTPEENFQKAAQKELGWREYNLSRDKSTIEHFFDKMVWITDSDSDSDLNISGKEMWELKKKVKYFDKTKEEYDKELEFYEVVTTTDIKPVIREHLEIYFKNQEGDPDYLYYRDNQNQDIRRYHIGQIGRDVTVERSRWYWPYYILLALFWGVVVAVIFGVILWLVFEDKKFAWITASLAFVLIFLLVLS